MNICKDIYIEMNYLVKFLKSQQQNIQRNNINSSTRRKNVIVTLLYEEEA